MNVLLCPMKWCKFKFKKKGFRWGTDRVVSHRLLLCTTKWREKGRKFGRGPIEQCVEDFCSLAWKRQKFGRNR